MRLDPADQGYPYSSATARTFLILTHVALLPTMRLAWPIRNSAPWLLFGLLGCLFASSSYHTCYSFDVCFFANAKIHKHGDHFLSTMLAVDIFTTFLWYRRRHPDDVTGDPPPSRVSSWPHAPPPRADEEAGIVHAGGGDGDDDDESAWSYCTRRFCRCCCCCNGCWTRLRHCALVEFYIGLPRRPVIGSDDTETDERLRAVNNINSGQKKQQQQQLSRKGQQKQQRKTNNARKNTRPRPPLLLVANGASIAGGGAVGTEVAARRLGYYRPLYINILMVALHILNIYFHLHLGWHRYADYLIFGIAGTIALISHITEILATGLRVRMVVLAVVVVPSILAYVIFYMDDYFGAIGHNVWHLLIFLSIYMYVRWGPIFVPADGMYVSLDGRT